MNTDQNNKEKEDTTKNHTTSKVSGKIQIIQDEVLTIPLKLANAALNLKIIDPSSHLTPSSSSANSGNMKNKNDNTPTKLLLEISPVPNIENTVNKRKKQHAEIWTSKEKLEALKEKNRRKQAKTLLKEPKKKKLSHKEICETHHIFFSVYLSR